ncbi:MAG: branched-chain amino acid aminotransferase [Clostridiales bacterium]|jgi:branched-chain amino acid aminotransferase|nr:branched-chain amino acid aminotransferase [Clostridiales bacterium]
MKITLVNERKKKPDFSNLGFGRYFTDHMAVIDYADGKWSEPSIEPYAPFLIDPAAMVFHYGQAVFEGLKAYRAVDGRILLFRPQMNFARFNHSNERMCIPHIDDDVVLNLLKELIKIEEEWIPSAPGTSLYIRPFIFATESAVGVHPSRNYKFMIILSPVAAYYASGLAPVSIIIEEEYVRSVRGGVGFTKSSANYAISLKGQEKAIEKGYAQVLWLDGIHRKYIEEVGTMNVFFKIGDTVVTPELNGSILAGVTRDSVIKILQSRGIAVEEKKISIDDICQAYDRGELVEVFGSGTAAVISPVGELIFGDKHMKINNGEIGPISQDLYDYLTGLQYGKVKDDRGWVMEVK